MPQPPDFPIHVFTPQGIALVSRFHNEFHALFQMIAANCPHGGRSLALVRTKLQEAYHFAIDAVVDNADVADGNPLSSRR